MEEYNQELEKLDKIKTDVLKLQETINEFQDDDMLSRVEEKLDILAQTDYSELINFSMESLKSDLSGQFSSVQNSLAAVSEKLRTNSNVVDAAQYDLMQVKENYVDVKEKLSKIIHMVQTNVGENEELNNRFESNLTRFNSGFQNIYDQFTKLDNVLQKNIRLFDTRFKDIYDQFSTIDIRTDIDQIKIYIQTFNNKLTGVSDIINGLKENNFSVNLDKIDALEDKFSEINEVQSKIDFLNRNLCSLLDKFDNDTFEIRMSNEKILEESMYLKQDMQGLSKKITDEISTFSAPLASISEIAGGLNETLHSFKEGLLGSPDELKALREDVSDTSSKLNKLILAQKENSDALKNELSENTKNQLQVNKESIKKLSEEFEAISRVIDEISEKAANNLEVSENMKDVIVYMAEWFDKAGKLIAETNENVKNNSIDKINTLLTKTETGIIDNIKKIHEKQNRLEIRLESIEGRIERVQDQSDNREVLLALSEVLEKIEYLTERNRANELILKRLEVKPDINDESRTVKVRRKNPQM